MKGVEGGLQLTVVVCGGQWWNHPDPALAQGKTCNCDVGPARTEMMRNYLDMETIKLRISK